MALTFVCFHVNANLRIVRFYIILCKDRYVCLCFVFFINQPLIMNNIYLNLPNVSIYQRFPSDSHPSKMAFSIHIEGKMIKRNFQQRLKLHNLQNDGSNFLVCTNISTLNAPIFSQQDKYKNTKIQIHKHKMLDQT